LHANGSMLPKGVTSNGDPKKTQEQPGWEKKKKRSAGGHGKHCGQKKKKGNLTREEGLGNEPETE